MSTVKIRTDIHRPCLKYKYTFILLLSVDQAIR